MSTVRHWLELPPEHFEISFGLVEDEHGLVHLLCEVSTRVWDEAGPNHSETLFCEDTTREKWVRTSGGRPVTCLGCIAEMGLIE